MSINMKSLALLTFFAICSLCMSQEYELVWEDNFDFIDTNKWQYEVTAAGGGNGEFQVYTPDSTNSYCENGHLFIKPTRTMDNNNPLTGQPFGEDYLWNGVMDLVELYGYCTNPDNYGCFREGQYGIIPPVMSTRLRSFQRFSFRFGRVEVRARMPVGDWLWPAIWMLPEDWAYGPWPVSGEIDIVESRGNRDLKINGNDIGMQEASSTMHWGLSKDENKFCLTTGARRNLTSDFGTNFHDYVLEWSEDGLRFIQDGQVLFDAPDPLIPENPNWSGFWDFGAPWSPGAQNPWENGDIPSMTPFDKNFHLILNVAVGGTSGMFPEDAVNQGGAAPKPWRNDANQPDVDFWNGQQMWYPTWQGNLAAMEIDYIRVYQRV